MDEFLRKFDTIRFVASWSIFRNFLRIFHFLNLNLYFEFEPVWYRSKPEPDQNGLISNRSNRTNSYRFCKPWWGRRLALAGWKLERFVRGATARRCCRWLYSGQRSAAGHGYPAWPLPHPHPLLCFGCRANGTRKVFSPRFSTFS